MIELERWPLVVRAALEDPGQLHLFPVEAEIDGRWRQTAVMDLMSEGPDGVMVVVATPDQGRGGDLPGIRLSAVPLAKTRPALNLGQPSQNLIEGLFWSSVLEPQVHDKSNAAQLRYQQYGAELAGWVEEFSLGVDATPDLHGCQQKETLATVIGELRAQCERIGGLHYTLAVRGESTGEIGEPVLVFTEDTLSRVSPGETYMIGRTQGEVLLREEKGARLWPVQMSPEWTGVYLVPAWIGHLARLDSLYEALGLVPAERAGLIMMRRLLHTFAESGKAWEELAATGVEVPVTRRETLSPQAWGLAMGEAL
jgi:hypothetical protein